MKKIAIVGVERSGKTVLMAAMGEKYKSPDANGIFLAPKDKETFDYYTRNSAMLRDEQWPVATSSSIQTELKWSVMRKDGKGNVVELGDLAFLDFGGEVYRLAFGGGTANPIETAVQIAMVTLQGHVASADILVVLVNLRDIINGSDSNARTIETKWLPLAILRYAQENSNPHSTILAFSMADSYSETIKQYGGLRKALAKYLPEVDAAYGDTIKLCAISSVDKTKPAPDNSGLSVPDRNFSSQGIDTLMSEIVANLKTSAKTTKATKQTVPKKKRGFWGWTWLFIRIAACIAAFFGGIGMKIYLSDTDVYHSDQQFKYIVDALRYGDFERFKAKIAEPPFQALPRKLREFAGVDYSGFGQWFYKERGLFWNACKNIRWERDYRPIFTFYSANEKMYVYKAYDNGARAICVTCKVKGKWKVVDWACEVQ